MKLRLFSFLLFSAFLALSCASEVREANINQDKSIDDFISSKYADYTVYHNGGTSRIVLVEGPEGAPVIEKGDSVYLYYAGYIFGNSGPTKQFVLDSGMFLAGAGKLIKGLEDGLPGARLGEESLIVFSADDGYGTTSVGLVPENSALLFDIGVAAIKKNP